MSQSTSVRTAGVTEEIRTKCLPNMSLDPYRCVNPLAGSPCYIRHIDFHCVPLSELYDYRGPAGPNEGK
jgi:hypothetical protein